jgi:hypothetical protein
MILVVERGTTAGAKFPDSAPATPNRPQLQLSRRAAGHRYAPACRASQMSATCPCYTSNDSALYCVRPRIRSGSGRVERRSVSRGWMFFPLSRR